MPRLNFTVLSVSFENLVNDSIIPTMVPRSPRSGASMATTPRPQLRRWWLSIATGFLGVDLIDQFDDSSSDRLFGSQSSYLVEELSCCHILFKCLGKPVSDIYFESFLS